MLKAAFMDQKLPAQNRNLNAQSMSQMDHWWPTNGWKWNVYQTPANTMNCRWTVRMYLEVQLAFLEWPLKIRFRAMSKRVVLPFCSRLYASLQSPFDQLLWLKEALPAAERGTTFMTGHRRQSMFVGYMDFHSYKCLDEFIFGMIIKIQLLNLFHSGLEFLYCNVETVL